MLDDVTVVVGWCVIVAAFVAAAVVAHLGVDAGTMALRALGL